MRQNEKRRGGGGNKGSDMLQTRTTTCKFAHTAAPFTMLSDNLDALHARSNCGIGDSEPLPFHAALGPRSCSGEGEGGSGRADPLRGGGESTVIC